MLPGCDVALCDPALFISLLLSPDSHKSPDCKLASHGSRKDRKSSHKRKKMVDSGAFCSQCIYCTRYFKHSLDDTASVRLFSSKRHILLKLVIWWHWSPSHPSISAESVRLIGGGGVLANSSTTFLVPDQKLFGGPTCLFDLLHSSGHHRLLLNVIK